MNSITITIPCAPPSTLLPNQKRKKHWGTIAKATRELRECAKYAAREQMPNDWTPYTGPVVLTLYVGYGRRRRIPDLDASAHACKGIIDGLTDAGVMVDDEIVKRLVVEHGRDPSGVGYTTLMFSPYPE